MNPKSMHEISLPLDERNLAHVFTALTLAHIVTRESVSPAEARCWWLDGQFYLRSLLSDAALLQKSENLVRSLRWVPALGVNKGKINSKAPHGILSGEPMLQGNAFLSFVDSGGDSSPFKMFSARQNPTKSIPEQIGMVTMKPDLTSWLGQRALGVSSWGFDSRVGSHAYDLGFSSNDEDSGELDPCYPAVELMALIAACSIAPAQLWQVEDSAIEFTIWSEPILTGLAPWAAAGRIELKSSRHYRTSDRGAAYGKGAAYRYFPSASLEP